MLLSPLTYLDYIELFPRFSCSIPTITWFRDAEKRIPETFKENRKWDVTILKAPECPSTVKILRLIKTAPLNFELRKFFQEYDPYPKIIQPKISVIQLHDDFLPAYLTFLCPRRRVKARLATWHLADSNLHRFSWLEWT